MDTAPAHAEIQALIDRFIRAHATRDADSIVALYENTAVIYDMAPPLGKRVDRDGVQEWLDTWDGGVTLDFDELRIVAGSELAFVSALTRMRGSKAGRVHDLWFRTTFCLRKRANGWRIAHDHTSVPFYMDGTDKAALDLKPE